MPRISPTSERMGYDLIGFTARGDERTDDPHGLMSDVILRTLAADEIGITDVFLLNHGWMADVPAARDQYDSWVKEMCRCEADLACMKKCRQQFKPHVIGIHWPSKPWGDSSLGGDGSFAAPGEATANPVESLVEEYSALVANTPKAKDCLRKIVTAGINDVNPESLSPDMVQCYRELNWEVDLGAGGVAPGADRTGFDPQAIYEALQEDSPSYGLLGSGGIFGVLRTLSFWRMKDRARSFGETSGSILLARMMQAAPRHLRFHLMGHSFGCIVAAATLAGAKGRGRVARPVDTLTLVQGALSIWSFCDDIPNVPGQQGYFRRVVSDGRVRGPILSTQSVFDCATGKWYPLGAGVARQVAFAAPGELPKYGALGSHGIRGPGTNAVDQVLLSRDQDYSFKPGAIYNLECSQVICNCSGSGGAHSDICHPEVAHAVWQAALAAP